MPKFNENNVNNFTFNNHNVYQVKYNDDMIWRKSTISLSLESCSFDSLIAGYGTPNSKTVTISNTSTFPTGQITVSRNDGNFQLNEGNYDSITIDSIPQNGTATFTVRPASGLSPDNYNGKITVIDGNGMQATFDVSVIVVPQIWSIDVSPSYVNFSSCTVGYGSVSSCTITVENTGNQPTGDITITRSPSNFLLSRTTISSLGVSESATFSVTPPTGLGVGSYDVSIIVNAANINGSITRNGSFTVKPQWNTLWSGRETFTSSGSFAVSGLGSGDLVQITAEADFKIYYVDQDGNYNLYNSSNGSLYRDQLPVSLYGSLGVIDFSHSGSQIKFNFREDEEHIKGGTFVGIPVRMTITEVRGQS